MGGSPPGKREYAPPWLYSADDGVLGRLPVDAVGRVGEAVVEGASGEQVVREGVAALDVGGVLALGDHVALADGVGLVVDLLPIEVQAGVGVAGLEVLISDREHPAGACGGVIDGPDDALLGQRVAVLGEHEVDGEADGVAGGEVLTGGLVGGFGELTDEFLEEVAHLGVGDCVGVEVDVGELGDDDVEPVVLFEGGDLVLELEPLEDVDVGGELGDVVDEVVAEPVGILLESGEVVVGSVVEVEPELLADLHVEDLWTGLGLGECTDLVAGGFEHTVEATQDRHREDDIAVLAGPVDAPQLVSDSPHKVTEVAHRLPTSSAVPRGRWFAGSLHRPFGRKARIQCVNGRVPTLGRRGWKTPGWIN